MKRLCLIDGANLVFRAHYAIRNLSNSRGLPTGALYGFAQMLLKLKRDEKPDLVAVCFDTAEPTFRDEMYAEYKSNRKEPPDDLVAQFPYVRPLAKVLGFPVVEKPGFEADDLIGTLAKRFASEGCEVVVVSGDKDLMQLVSPNVTMLDGMKDLRIGPDEVAKKFGVGPEKVVEVLGLSGDASDNIPGVLGIGPKTATALIQKYGSVEEVIAHAAEIKGQLGEKIREQADQARLSRKLARIDTDVDIEIGEEALRSHGMDEKAAKALFAELEFSKLLMEILPVGASEKKDYRIIGDEKGLEEVVREIKSAGLVSIVFKLKQADSMLANITGIGLAWQEGVAAYVPIANEIPFGQNADLFEAHAGAKEKAVSCDEFFKKISSVIAGPNCEVIGHNLNPALTIFHRMETPVANVAFDTMLASYVLSPNEDHSLSACSLKYLGVRISDDDKASDEADCVLRLKSVLEKKIKEGEMEGVFYKIEMPLVPVLVNMQLAGVLVDMQWLKKLSSEFAGKLSALENKIYALAGSPFNINSPKQLGDVLFVRLKLPGGKRTKTGFSTSQDILEELSAGNELPRLVLEYRSFSKLKGTYVDALPLLVNPETGRIHTSFNQAVTATGRLSSSNPNLQNIPIRGEDGIRIRRAFIAEEGFKLISADYSQIELRVLAHMSGDDRLVDAFLKNEDVHAVTAAGIFGAQPAAVTKEQRAIGKTVNFATIYGQGAWGLAKQLGIEPKAAAEYIENYFKRYPGVAGYREEILNGARRNGFVETLFGRRRFLPDIQSPNQGLAALSERVAFNTVFQGTAADIIKIAMISIHAALPKISKGARMILQVHDELIFEVPEKDVEQVKSFVTKEMENAANLKVPLIADVAVGKTWADAH